MSRGSPSLPPYETKYTVYICIIYHKDKTNKHVQRHQRVRITTTCLITTGSVTRGLYGNQLAHIIKLFASRLCVASLMPVRSVGAFDLAAVTPASEAAAASLTHQQMQRSSLRRDK